VESDGESPHTRPCVSFAMQHAFFQCTMFTEHVTHSAPHLHTQHHPLLKNLATTATLVLDRRGDETSGRYEARPLRGGLVACSGRQYSTRLGAALEDPDVRRPRPQAMMQQWDFFVVLDDEAAGGAAVTTVIVAAGGAVALVHGPMVAKRRAGRDGGQVRASSANGGQREAAAGRT